MTRFKIPSIRSWRGEPCSSQPQRGGRLCRGAFVWYSALMNSLRRGRLSDVRCRRRPRRNLPASQEGRARHRIAHLIIILPALSSLAFLHTRSCPHTSPSLLSPITSDCMKGVACSHHALLHSITRSAPGLHRRNLKGKHVGPVDEGNSLTPTCPQASTQPLVDDGLGRDEHGGGSQDPVGGSTVGAA